MPILISIAVILVIAAAIYLLAGPIVAYFVIGKSMAKFTSAPVPVPMTPSSGPFDVSLDPNSWTIQFSNGMPPHPEAWPNGGWFINMPMKGSGDVHYVISALNRNISGASVLTVSLGVESAGDSVYIPSDTREGPPCKVSVMLQRFGDNMSGAGQYEGYRQWALTTFQLPDGTATLQIPLQADQWMNVMGHTGDVGGFNGCLANLGNIGLTFGGSSFAGHGVSITQGAARFFVTQIRIS